ncbi:ROK family protein [Ferruginivarius sediminum]|uniref:ROK family protein n=1 Tax=Ferruginivarius sediminum TaxID=2661937 RepID=A0A369TBM3_9PROT|nr:ROK family protein [Ferruginivarius sediminum]RDD62741.1 ROK family protein [Ferruginivarius sediminum]
MLIGIDLGGTKIEGVALDHDGACRARRRVPTRRGDYNATIADVRGLVDAIESDLDARASVGVGIPGAISPATGLVKNANSTWLIGKPLERDLARALDRPVRLANDADCFALSEATDGAAANESPVFGAILGTGVGGGIVVRGQLISGPNAIAGEWGHNPLPAPRDDERPGPPCYCGRSGCIETFLSGPGLVADYLANSGREGDARMVAMRAGAGEAAAKAALDRYCDRLARALAGVINILDPAVIVLGGGLSNLAHLYEELPERLQPHVFSDRVDTRIVPPVHGDSSGVRGAARLWRADERAEAVRTLSEVDQ